MTYNIQTLNCSQWNSNGLLKSNLEELKHFLRLTNPDLVIVSETHWIPKINPSFQNYKLFRKDRQSGHKGGGVAILVHNSIHCVPFLPPSSHLIETVGVTIQTEEIGRIDVISAYCPNGDAARADLSAAFQNILVSPRSPNFIIGGDLNAHHSSREPDRSHNNCGNSLSSLISEMPGLVLVTPFNLGTRLCPLTGKLSTIDLILATSHLSANASVKKSPLIGSDHHPVTTTFKVTPSRAKRRPPKWIFDGKNWGKWNDDLSRRLAGVVFTNSPLDAYSCFVDSLFASSKKFFRLSSPDSSKSKEPSKPWFLAECKRHVALERLALGAWLSNLGSSISTDLNTKWKKARAIKKRVIRKSKSEAWESFSSNLSPQGSHSKLWSLSKRMTGRGAPPPIDGAALSDGCGNLITAPNIKASIFLDKYAAAGGLRHEGDPELEDFIESEINSDKPNPLNMIFSTKELDSALSNLKKKKRLWQRFDSLRNAHESLPEKSRISTVRLQLSPH